MKNSKHFFILLLVCCQLNVLSAQFSISGNITCVGGEIVEGQEVQLNGALIGDITTTTDNNGNYNFSNLNAGEDYTITVEKEEVTFNFNGVSTYDVVLISKHLLGTQLLSSPFDFFGADINNSGTITVFDMYIIQELLLGLPTSYPVLNWRFVSSDYNHLAGTGSVGGASISNLQEDQTIDFVQVKTGDVNRSSICE